MNIKMRLNNCFFGGFHGIYLNHREIETNSLPIEFRKLNRIIFNMYFSIHSVLQKEFNKTKK
jgi:hypothetical protein